MFNYCVRNKDVILREGNRDVAMTIPIQDQDVGAGLRSGDCEAFV